MIVRTWPGGNLDTTLHPYCRGRGGGDWAACGCSNDYFQSAQMTPSSAVLLSEEIPVSLPRGYQTHAFSLTSSRSIVGMC